MPGDLSVLELSLRVRDLFGTVFPYPVWVRGVLSGRIRPNQKGHVYFQLVEPAPGDARPAASVDCALFAGSRARVERDFARAGVPFDPPEGCLLRVLARVDLWPQSGRFQLVVESIDPESLSGGGTLLGRLVEKLGREGLTAKNPSLPMPLLPLRVGLVTAPGSAAAHDFLATLRESGYPFEVLLHPVQVQGTGTGGGIASALRSLTRLEGIQAVVVTRGGGSPQDLAWFDDEELGRAVAAAPWPVISAIGHEVDFTLPDFVAHTRAKTPTHAASILVDRAADAGYAVDDAARDLESAVVPRLRAEAATIASNARVLAYAVGSISARTGGSLDRMASWLPQAAGRRTRFAREEVERIGSKLAARDFPALRRMARDAELAARELVHSSKRRLDAARTALDGAGASVTARDAARMLALGWATARGPDGRLLRSVRDTTVGAPVIVGLRDGSITSRVEEIESRGDPVAEEGRIVRGADG